MITKRIALLKAQLSELKEDAEITHTKMVIASASCPIATEVHYLKLNKLNTQYLDIDEELQMLLKVPVAPSQHIPEDQAVS